MSTFAEFVGELSKKEIVLSPPELQQMRRRFGDKTLQMGHIQDDGSMLVPVDCIVEAAQLLGSQKLMEAAETLKGEEVASMLQSVEALVEQVAAARKRRLGQLVEKFQSEPSDGSAHQQWKEIEEVIFGVEYPD